MKVAGVKFSDNTMPKYFATQDLDLKKGDFCICQVEDREETGYVVSLEYRTAPPDGKNIYPPIIRKAEQRDRERWEKLKDRERKALDICRQKAQEHNLLIKITNVRFDDKNNKIIFHFTSDKRVDFRELVRDLASTLRSRIELWQIGVRDEARIIDGMGICGRRLCCASFLKDFQPVTIRLAKNQDIFLSPNKLSGCCGRLMCCLAYEEEQYRRMADNAPPLGARVRTRNLSGAVIERNLIGQTCVIQDENNNKHHVPFSGIIKISSPEKITAGKTEDENNTPTREDEPV